MYNHYLDVFIIVADSGSFAKAGKKLYGGLRKQQIESVPCSGKSLLFQEHSLLYDQFPGGRRGAPGDEQQQTDAVVRRTCDSL